MRIGAQKSFILKEVITKDLHQQFEKSNGQMNIILSYFEKNYKAVSEKLNVLIDEEMGGVLNVDIPKNLSLGLNIPITIAARLNL